MSKMLQFPTERKKYQKSENNSDIYSIYLEEYGIYILTRDKQEKEGEYENQDYRDNLESIIKQFEKDIEKQIIKQRDNLEEKIQDNNEKYIISNSYKNKQKQDKNLYSYIACLAQQSTGHHTNQKSGANIFYVSPSALPENVLGMYVPSTHTIYIANNLSQEEERFVYYHEEYHSIYGAGEESADAYATARTGYNLRQAA